MSFFSKGFNPDATLERIRQPAAATPDARLGLSDASELALKVSALVGELRPAGVEGADAAAALPPSKHVEIIGRAGSQRLRLNAAARREVLSWIADADDAKRVIETAEIAETDLGRAMLEYLQGTRPAVAQQSYRELALSYRAVYLLSRIANPPELPSLWEINACLSRNRITEALEGLTAEGFYGRELEMTALRRHVGLLDDDGFSLNVEARDIRRMWRSVFDQNRQPPMVIHGPGGIGKSTLLAKFILDHLAPDMPVKFPFAYLDFERASLSPRDPHALFAEIVRQLKVQYPAGGAFDRIDKLLAEQALARRQESLAAGETKHLERLEATRYDQAQSTVRELAACLGKAVRDGQPMDDDDSGVPFLLVFDSFEEAQQHSLEAVARLARLFAQLSEAYPLLRVVVSGRVPVRRLTSAEPEYLPLSELSARARRAYLTDHDVPERVARWIGRYLGGNPLTLRLTAQLFRRLRANDPDGSWLEQIERKPWYSWADDDALIQGQLYQRILERIEHTELEKLAHPGLVLRRITPDVIREVLAEPCGVAVPDDIAARSLLEAFRDRVDLVEARDAEDVLYHRPDVRKVMLSLIERDQPEVSRQIQERAVAYYERFDDPERRAEEIYHRLRLGEHPGKVEARWLQEVARYLEDALDEVPEKAQAFLAAKLGGVHDLPDSVYDAADLEDWERLAARSARSLLESGDAKKALAQVRERKERSAQSAIHEVEARALMALERYTQAEKLVDGALRQASTKAPPAFQLALYCCLAEAVLAQGRTQEMPRLMDIITSLGRRAGDPYPVLTTLLKGIGATEGEVQADLRETLQSVVAETDLTTLASYPELLGAVARELFQFVPDTLRRLVAAISPPRELNPQIVNDFSVSAEQLSRTDSTVDLALRRSFSELGYTVPERLDADGIAAGIMRSADDSRVAEWSKKISEIAVSNPSLTQLLGRLLFPR